jgi:K+ transporter
VDAFIVVYRLFALGVVLLWFVQIAIAIRKPPEWQPPRFETLPFRVTRNLYVLAGVLGIIGGVAVFAGSFVLFP